MSDCTCVILCGGQSSRMGRDKACLPWHGGTLTDVLAERLAAVGAVYLSVESEHHLTGAPYPRLFDAVQGCGPIGGLAAALRAAQTPLVFVTACDMPYITADTVRTLQQQLAPWAEAIVPIDASGVRHPLCAIYRAQAAPSVEAVLQAGKRKLRDCLAALRVQYVPVFLLPQGEKTVCNLNTPAAYETAYAAEAQLLGKEQTNRA